MGSGHTHRRDRRRNPGPKILRCAHEIRRARAAMVAARRWHGWAAAGAERALTRTAKVLALATRWGPARRPAPRRTTPAERMAVAALSRSTAIAWNCSWSLPGRLEDGRRW